VWLNIKMSDQLFQQCIMTIPSSVLEVEKDEKEKEKTDKKKTAPRPSGSDTPTHVFLIPYRDRKEEMCKFNETMPSILDKDIGNGRWAIIYVHQCNTWLFSRGSLFNMGFQEVKRRWPEDWKNIQLVLHDVDIYPTKPCIIDYDCKDIGIARHPYGVLRPQFGGTVGGICVVYGEDYMRVNGSPNYLGWGGEDVSLCRRLKAVGIKIDEKGFIERRSRSDIVDKDSHPDSDREKFNLNVTDRRNLTRVANEDMIDLTKNSGINSIFATKAVLRAILPPNSEYHKLVTMLDIQFEIMDLV